MADEKDSIAGTVESPATNAESTTNKLNQMLDDIQVIKQRIDQQDFDLFSQRVGGAMWVAEQIIYGEVPPVGFMSVDDQGRILYMNGKAQQMFGYEVHEIRGKEVEVLLPYRLRDQHVRYRKLYMEDPRPRVMGKGRIPAMNLSGLHKSGNEFDVLILMSPTFREGHRVINLQITPL